ncbi:DUF2167 domain-containing protein [Nibribacter ruber]|uniref:DUF2167 domain-containing protein n=1 Tax=Nibribacter ruber TaxID=2698458 RepID=A0A6P1NRZ1_9BACT|nr:DUF2167 domain-containing protein [Nibribacter ruber]QHL86437.1 DUF2167 domain-containing protein [Nibribacter ruber]
MRKLYPLLVLLFCLPLCASAEVDSLKVWRDSVNASYTYQTGVITLQNGLAKISVPKGYKYLDGKQSEDVLTNLWGNPPGHMSLGMLFPENSGPATATTWAIDISYDEEGHIKDDDAKDINYDDLLKEMQEQTIEENKVRAENNYEPIELVGWAVPPFYDEATHKLHWAKELKFGDATLNTLNYNIRILGRNGYLTLNAIGDMDMVAGIQKDIPGILASVEFIEGSRYADFNPDLDDVAAYGIGGLIAGKVLAKAGFFALLLKFWKVIMVAIVALFTGIKKFFGGRSSSQEVITEAVVEEEEEKEELAAK